MYRWGVSTQGGASLRELALGCLPLAPSVRNSDRHVLRQYEKILVAGALIVVDEAHAQVRLLPFVKNDNS